MPTQHSSRSESLMGTHLVAVCSGKKIMRAFFEVASAQPCSNNENAVVGVQSPFGLASSHVLQY